MHLFDSRQDACSQTRPAQTCFDEFHREFWAATTGLDRRQDGGGVARYSSIRFRHAAARTTGLLIILAANVTASITMILKKRLRRRLNSRAGVGVAVGVRVPVADGVSDGSGTERKSELVRPDDC